MSEQDKDFLDGMGDDTPAEAADESDIQTGEPTQPEPEVQAQPAEAKQTEVPPTPGPKQEERVPLAALKAEREKRQQFERELQELRAEKEKLKTAEPEKRPDFFADPEKFVAEALRNGEQVVLQRMYAALEADAREQYADYDDVLESLKPKLAENPALHQQIFGAPNPAKAAYKLGKQLQEMEALKDPEAYRAQLEKELREQIRAELEAEQKAKAAAAIPPDLASARNARTATAVPPESVFDDIFKR
ncbi:hypothetical protein [Coralloluteibacterium thermophilus]|uniref:DUF4355 domain-containing protein n=1 Tax=Coralloluteibacterium thermophilum TaxID=2707049 RepID=A0ABV9NMU1_9GAMM